MADHRITDFVDQEAIDRLKELSTEMVNVKDTYVDVARELLKGIRIKVEGLDDLERMTSTLAQQELRAAQATETLNRNVAEQKKIVAETTATIARDMQERNKANREIREEYKEHEKVKSLLDQLNGTYEEHVRALNKQNASIKAVTAEQKSLKKAYEEGRISESEYNTKLDETTVLLRQLKQEKSNLEIMMRNEEKLALAVDGSYNQMSQQLELLKKAYKSMTDEEKASPIGAETIAAINALDSHLKDLDEDMGQHQRNVGDYAIATGSVKKELKELVLEIANATIAYRAMSDEEKASAEGQELAEHIQEMTVKAGNLKDAIADTNEAIKNQASDTQAFDQMSAGIQLLIDGFGLATGAASMLGLSETDLVEVQTKLQAAIVASNAVSKIQQTLQRQSALMQGVSIIQTKAHTVAIKLKTAAESQNVIVSKAATVAQAAFNAVAKANPYVLLAVAIVTVIGAIAAYISSTKESTNTTRENTAAEKEREEQMERNRKLQETMSNAFVQSATAQMDALSKLRTEWNLLGDDMIEKQRFIEENKEAFQRLGVSVKTVSDAENVLNKNTNSFIRIIMLRAKAAAYAQAITEAWAEAIRAIDANRSVKVAVAHAGDTYKNKVGNGAPDGWYAAGLKEGDDYTVTESYFSDSREYTLTAAGANKLTNHRLEKAKKEAIQRQRDARSRAEDTERRLTQEMGNIQNEITALYNTMGIAAPPKYNTNNKSNNQTNVHTTPEKDDSKSFEDFTKADLERLKELYEKQVAAEEEGTEKWLDVKKKLLFTNEQLEKKEAEDAYKVTEADLKNSLEKKKITQDQYDTELKKAQKDRDDIIEANHQKTLNDMADAEEKYTDVTLENIEKLYASKQSALDEDYNETVNTLKTRMVKELRLAGDNEEERARIKQEYEDKIAVMTEKYAYDTAQNQIEMYEEILAVETLTAEEREEMETKLAETQIQLQQAITDAIVNEEEREREAHKMTTEQYKKELEERMNKTKRWLQVAADGLNAINDLASSIYDGKMQRIEEEEKALEEASTEDQERITRLVEQNVITEEEGEARKRAAEARTAEKTEELEKKKQQLKYKQAVWDKANSIAQVGINTAMAIMTTMAQMGMPAAIPFIAIAGAMGAIQLATVLATPIPKYAEGTDYHRGGLAIVGDAGEHEVVAVGTKMYITPKVPTLVDMPRGAQVFPSINDFVAPSGFVVDTTQSPEMPNVVVNNDYRALQNDVRELAYLIKKQTKQQHRDAYHTGFERYKTLKG